MTLVLLVGVLLNIELGVPRGWQSQNATVARETRIARMDRATPVLAGTLEEAGVALCGQQGREKGRRGPAGKEGFSPLCHVSRRGSRSLWGAAGVGWRQDRGSAHHQTVMGLQIPANVQPAPAMPGRRRVDFRVRQPWVQIPLCHSADVGF